MPTALKNKKTAAAVEKHENLPPENIQKEALLRVSQAIASIQKKEELLKVIFKDLQPVFGFYDIGLSIISTEENTVTDWSVLMPDVSPSDSNIALNRAGLFSVPYINSAIDEVIGKIEKTGRPLILEIGPESIHEYPDFKDILAIELKNGLREMWFVNLKAGGKLLGALNFNAQEKNYFKQFDPTFFQSIADQLSVAVANILANEELAKRDAEKSLLLALSEDISMVRNREELAAIILTKVKPLFDFFDCSIQVVDEDNGLYQLIKIHQPATNSADEKLLSLSRINEENSFEYQGSFLQLIIQQLQQAKQPVLLNLMADYSGFTDNSLLTAMQVDGYNTAVAALLRTRGRMLGCFVINFKQLVKKDQVSFSLFQSLVDQLSAAVSNILANEEILARENEKTQLLNISNAIASIREKDDLLKVIVQQIKPLFNFEDCGLFVLDKEAKWLVDLAGKLPEISPSNLNDKVHAAGAYKIAYDGSAVKTVMEKLAVIDQPLIYNYKTDSIAGWDEYEQAALITASGMEQSMMTLLKTGGNLLGVFMVNSYQPDFFQQSQFKLFQATADLLAVALANILANQEIVDREKEKTILLTISEDIASVRDKKDLLKIILTKVKAIFNFYDTGILVLDEEGCYHDWAVIIQGIDESAVNQSLRTDDFYRNNGMQLKGSAVSWIIEEIERQKKPILFDYQHPDSRFTDYTLLQSLKAGGYKEGLAGLLKNAGEVLGVFTINFLENDKTAAIETPLFQNIAEQLSVALANILANDEIVERETEKTSLLRISEAISAINNRTDLLNTVYQYILPVFPFDSAGLFVTEEDKDIIYEILDSAALPDDLQKKLAYENKLGPWKLSASNKESWWMQKQIVISSMEAEAAKARLHTGDEQFEAGLAYGLQQMIGGPLYANAKKIGAICFNSKMPDRYSERDTSMFKSISEQVGVAVANILANEEILEREKEKEQLLAISKSLSAIRLESNFWEEATTSIRPLINYDDAVIVLLEKDKNHYRHLLSHSPKEIKNHVVYKQLISQKLPVKGSLFEYLFTRQGTFQLDNKELLKQYPEYPGLKMVTQLGFLHTLAIALNTGGTFLGQLYFHFYKKENINLAKLGIYTSIGEQVAVAIANILANEELQQKECHKTLQIEVGKALAEELTWPARLLRCIKLFQDVIENSLSLVTIMLDDDNFITYGFYRTGKEEYELLEQADLHRILNLNPEQFRQQWTDVEKRFTNPVAYSEKELTEVIKQHPLALQLMSYFRLQHNMIFPMLLSKYKMVVFSFYTQQENPYSQQKVELLNEIQNYIALCFDRILAYDELERYSKRIREENKYLQEEIKSEYNFDSIIGNSRVLKEVFRNISMVASADTTVLILGETGTGKELIARSLHNSSPRNKKSIIKINCAALPAQLIESELFGHEKGSFTGAFEKRIGKFELADGGSIFLDEIGELPLELQSKLLRVLQEKEFERIGGSKTIQCDVRIIAATNRKLEEEVEKGRFRADLYYRLNVFPIHLPPLRERTEDIPLLATYFAQRFCKKMNKPFRGILPEMMDALISYNWPGNIRELENVMEQAVIVNQGKDGLGLARQLLFVQAGAIISAPAGAIPATAVVKTFATVKQEKESLEKAAITKALQKTSGRIRGIKGAAALLDILPTTLESKMKKYGISKYAFGTLGQ